MSLQNKDGKPFELNQPNPIMIEQSIWDKKELIIHNKFGKIVSAIKNNNKIESKLVEVKKIEVEVKQEVPVEISPTSLQEDEWEIDESDKIQIWCLPVVKFQSFKDPMYQESYKKPLYGKKFLFEAVLMSLEDTSMIFWTNISNITLSSVVYPRTADKRWWRVSNVVADSGGATIYSLPSDFEPDFS